MADEKARRYLEISQCDQLEEEGAPEDGEQDSGQEAEDVAESSEEPAPQARPDEETVPETPEQEYQDVAAAWKACAPGQLPRWQCQEHEDAHQLCEYLKDQLGDRELDYRQAWISMRKALNDRTGEELEQLIDAVWDGLKWWRDRISTADNPAAMFVQSLGTIEERLEQAGRKRLRMKT